MDREWAKHGGIELSGLRALCDAETAIENCRSGDGNAVSSVRGPPHAPVFSHAGVCDIVDTSFGTRAGNWNPITVPRPVVDQGSDVV